MTFMVFRYLWASRVDIIQSHILQYCFIDIPPVHSYCIPVSSTINLCQVSLHHCFRATKNGIRKPELWMPLPCTQVVHRFRLSKPGEIIPSNQPTRAPTSFFCVFGVGSSKVFRYSKRRTLQLWFFGIVFADGRVSDPMAKCIFLGWVGWDGM